MIDQLFEARASLENPTVSLNDPDAIAEVFGGSHIAETGKVVSHKSALGLSAFWCAVKMISGDVSQLPLHVVDYPDAAAGMPKPVKHSLRSFIRPHAYVTPDTPDLTFLQLMRRVMTHALIYENGYIWADIDRGGKLRGLYQLLSDRTRVTMFRGRRYVVTELQDEESQDGWRLVARPYEEVIHIEGLCLDNMAGFDTVMAARNDVAVALEAVGFKAKFFKNRMAAGGILQAPEGATPENVKKIEKAIEALQGGEEAFRTLILRDGYRWHSTQVKPGEAQLTDLEESGVRDVARRFCMQPARLGVRESISYNSLESEKRDYHGTTLSYWLSSNASQFTAKLLTTDEKDRGLEVAYNANLRLLWADAQTLSSIATQGTANAAWLDENEARGWFMLPPRETEEGDSEENDTEDETNPPDDETDETEEDRRGPFIDLLAAELRRHASRAAVQADRARKRGELSEFRDNAAESRNAQIAAEGLAPVVAAIAAADMVLADDAAGMAATIVRRAVDLAVEGQSDPNALQELAQSTAAAAFSET